MNVASVKARLKKETFIFLAGIEDKNGNLF